MKKTFLSIALLLCAIVVSSQTARKLTVNITPDGESNMQVFLPQNPNGKTVVGCPGGGYSHLSMQNEGTDWVEYFNSQGIAYCVLKYRMPKGDRTIPMSDAQNAIRTVRDSAQAWNVSPYAVGIMGFSAGGHLASTTANHSPIEARPDFQILFYPVISMDEKQTHKGSCVNFLGEDRRDEKLVKQFSNMNAVRRHQTPPAIIFTAGDDRAVPPATNCIPYYLALRKAGVPAAMHIYPAGGHGFGFRSSFANHKQMTEELSNWIKSLKLPMKDAVRVACVGNSITDGHGIDMVDVNSYPAQMQRMLGDGYCVKNFGVSGRTMLNKGNRPYMKEKAWAEAKAFNPNIVVIKLGTNDSKPINWDNHSKEYMKDMQQMIDELNALQAKPVIYLCNPLQANHQTNDKQGQIRDSIITADVIPMIKKVAKKNKLEIIDLNPLIDPNGEEMLKDGIHPNAKGAKKMAETIAKAIRKQ